MNIAVALIRAKVDRNDVRVGGYPNRAIITYQDEKLTKLVLPNGSKGIIATDKVEKVYGIQYT